MQPRDLAHLRTPSAPTLTPDGRLVAVAVGRIDLEANEYRAELWVMPTDGSSRPRRFTSGRRDVRPRFSPDGRWLAFLRAGDDDKPQLHVMATDGGEPRRVCEHPLGVESFAWSPDSTRLAYVARVPEEGRYGTDKDVPPEKEPPRRITGFKYRVDNVGFTFDRRPHVFVVDALADDAEIRAAFDTLGLGWWVEGLPRGVHTRVGERGDYLSVGERQLVALARGHLADPGCLILDEATSAVDPATEVALRNAIARLTQGRTAITIAHRLATAEHADLVLVMERGRLVQRGTHAQLLADRDGAYARLHGSWLASLSASGQPTTA